MRIKKEVVPLLGELEMLWVRLAVTAKMLKIVNGVTMQSVKCDEHSALLTVF